MNSFFSHYPNADDILKMAPEDLAPTLLRLALN